MKCRKDTKTARLPLYSFLGHLLPGVLAIYHIRIGIYNSGRDGVRLMRTIFFSSLVVLTLVLTAAGDQPPSSPAPPTAQPTESSASQPTSPPPPPPAQPATSPVPVPGAVNQAAATPDSLGKQIRDWGLFAFALIGAIVGIFGFWRARKASELELMNAQLAQETADITRQLKVEQFLAAASDFLGGGEPGTTGITDFPSEGQLELARRKIEQALVSGPDSPRAHRYKGIYLVGSGRLDEAVKEFRIAIELDPKDAKTRSNLGIVLGQLGEFDEAVKEFRIAIRLDPSDDARAYTNLGNALWKNGKLDEAIKEFRIAVKLDPGFRIAKDNLQAALQERNAGPTPDEAL